MLSYLQAIVIGLLQGVTELFPVSSLGHSVLVPALIGGNWEHLVTESSTSTSGTSPYLAFIVAAAGGQIACRFRPATSTSSWDQQHQEARCDATSSSNGRSAGACAAAHHCNRRTGPRRGVPGPLRRGGPGRGRQLRDRRRPCCGTRTATAAVPASKRRCRRSSSAANRSRRGGSACW